MNLGGHEHSDHSTHETVSGQTPLRLHQEDVLDGTDNYVCRL